VVAGDERRAREDQAGLDRVLAVPCPERDEEVQVGDREVLGRAAQGGEPFVKLGDLLPR